MHPKIATLIPRAIEAVHLFLMAPNQVNLVKKEYDGYAASLGATIRTSSLLPALTFYTDLSREYPYRSDILEAINYCLDDTITAEVRPIITKQGKPVPDRDQDNARALMKKVLVSVHGQDSFDREGLPPKIDTPKKEKTIREWSDDIIRASVALKLAMRNFKHTEE